MQIYSHSVQDNDQDYTIYSAWVDNKTQLCQDNSIFYFNSIEECLASDPNTFETSIEQCLPIVNQIDY